jgi:hypothetical protein
MGMIVYPQYRKAYNRVESNLNFNQQALIYYIYSNLKIGNLFKFKNLSELKIFEDLEVPIKTIFNDDTNNYSEDNFLELFSDIDDLVLNKKILIGEENLKEYNVTFFDKCQFNDSNKTLVFKVNWILIKIIVTNQLMTYAIEVLNIKNNLELLMIATGLMTCTVRNISKEDCEYIILTNGKMKFV